MQGIEQDTYIQKRINKAEVLGLEYYSIGTQPSGANVYLIIHKENKLNAELLIPSDVRCLVNANMIAQGPISGMIVNLAVSKKNSVRIDSLGLQALKIYGGSGLKSVKNLFMYCEIGEVDITGLDTSNVTDMSQLFYKCKSKIKGFDKLNTSKVENMAGMFSKFETYRIRNGDFNLSNLDTSNVKDMRDMLLGIKVKGNLDISGLNMENVKEAETMLGCMEIYKDLNMSNIRAPKLLNAYGLLYDTHVHGNLNLSGLEISNMENNSMFNRLMVNGSIKCSGTKLKEYYTKVNELINEHGTTVGVYVDAYRASDAIREKILESDG